jgi:hypothetical protein
MYRGCAITAADRGIRGYGLVSPHKKVNRESATSSSRHFTHPYVAMLLQHLVLFLIALARRNGVVLLAPNAKIPLQQSLVL